MPYEDERFYMLIILPKANGSLADLEDKLTTFDLGQIRQRLEDTELDLTIPKFKVDFSHDLNEPLEKVSVSLT